MIRPMVAAGRAVVLAAGVAAAVLALAAPASAVTPGPVPSPTEYDVGADRAVVDPVDICLVYRGEALACLPWGSDEVTYASALPDLLPWDADVATYGSVPIDGP